ncbi:MAG: polysaccharide biosynthesis C-terminal domain-containing protein [Chitinophagales bacterium]
MKKFLRSAFLISAGGALPLLSSVVLLYPYTQNLNTGDFGALAIFISFTILVQFLMNYGMDTYLSVHYFDHHNDPAALKVFLSKISGMLLLYGIILIILFAACGNLLFRLVFPGGNIAFFPYGLMSVVTAFFNTYFRTYVNLQVFGDKPWKYFSMGLFNFVVTVTISTVLIYQHPFSLFGPMWGRFLSGVLIFLLSLWFVLREFGLRIDLSMLPDIRKYTTPLLLFNLLTWVLGYVNNYILNAYETTADVGVYDFALKCTLLIEYAGLGVLGTINPRIYKYWRENALTASTQYENRYHHVYSAFNIVFIAFNILIIPVLVHIFVLNESYYASLVFVPILCVSFVFRGAHNMFLNPLYFFKQTKKLPLVFSIAAVIQVVLGILFTKYWGIAGAVWSYFAVKVVQVFLLWIVSRRYFTFRFNIVKMIVLPGIYTLCVIFLFTCKQLQMLEASLIQIGLALVLVGIVFRREIITLPGFWKKA